MAQQPSAGAKTLPIQDLTVIAGGTGTVTEAINSFMTEAQLGGLNILSLDVLHNIQNATTDFTAYGTLTPDEGQQLLPYYNHVAEGWKTCVDNATSRKAYLSTNPHCIGDALALRLDEVQGASNQLSNVIVLNFPSALATSASSIASAISSDLESAISAFASVTCPPLSTASSAGGSAAPATGSAVSTTATAAGSATPTNAPTTSASPQHNSASLPYSVPGSMVLMSVVVGGFAILG